MKMALVGETLLIREADNVQYQVIRSWGRMNYHRPKGEFSGPANLELLDKLAGIVRLPPNVEDRRKKLRALQVAVDRERTTENPAPLVKYPVKLALYKHQIRAANMALLTFGLVQPEGGEQ